MHTTTHPRTSASSTQRHALWKLIGKTIFTRPWQVRMLLEKYRIPVRRNGDFQALTDAVFLALESRNPGFQEDITALLSAVNEKEDQFIGAIAGAVGAVAGAIGSGQQKKAAREQAKAMKEEAKANTLSSILAYKAQQDQTRLQASIHQAQQKAKPAQSDNKKTTQTILIIAGVVVALILVGLFMMQPKKVMPMIHPSQHSPISK